MPINPKTIQAFLDQQPFARPDFKAMDETELRARIKASTGEDLYERTPLRRHQLVGVAAALHMERVLLHFDMQLGKTLIGLQWASQLRATGHWTGTGLIVAHAPIALDVWTSQAAQHSYLDVIAVRSKIEELEAALEQKPDLIVMSWSGMQQIFTIKRLASRGKRKGQNKLYPHRPLLREAAEVFDLAIIDEIHTCNNHMSLRFEMARELLAHCRYRVGLTGTPVGRFPLAMWAQCFLIDEGETLGKNYYFFESVFTKMVYDYGAGIKLPKFDKALLPVMQHKISGLSIPYKRDEVKASDIQQGLIELTMKGDQLAAYQDLIKEVVAASRNDEEYLLNSYINLRRISSGYHEYIDTEGQKRFHRFKNAVKTEWLLQLFADLPSDVSVILFHEFTETGNLICDVLTGIGVKHTWLYGGTQDKPGAVEAFQSRQVQVLVANTATGGTSIGLNAADYLCFFESPPSPIKRAQAEARPMGERGDRALYRDDVICSPVERIILGYIKEGKELEHSLIFNVGSSIWRLL